MWILRNSKGEPYYLLTGKQHIVGRRDADLFLQNDQSISRKHAILEVEHKSENWANPQMLPVVKLIEAGAKYGTSVIPNEGEKETLPANSTRILKDGDQIQFGLQWNIWKLQYTPLVASLSTLSSEEKKNVKAVISKLGGHVVETWSSFCTHLTMCTITLTVKAVCALADGKPIVTPEMWNRYLASAEANTPLPSYEEFIPPLGESVIKKNEVSFKINENRKTLFVGKKFIFFSKSHCNQHRCLVLAAGGEPVCLEDTKIRKEELISPDVIVMQIADRSSQLSQCPSFYSEYLSYLQGSSRRLIPVSEIGLAVLHCSLEKYCNPSFSFASTMLKGTKTTVIQDSSEPVLAIDTQEAEALCGKIKASSSDLSGRKKIIPESGTTQRECPSSACLMKDPQGEELQNTASLDINHSPKKSPCVQQQTRVQHSPFTNNLMSRPTHFKRPLDEDIAPNRTKRQHLIVKEESGPEENLFAFVSDKDDTRNDAELFSFVDDQVKDSDIGELNINDKTQKRKMSDDVSPHIVPTKKPHIMNSKSKQSSSKESNEENTIETEEDFVTFPAKIEVKEEKDEHFDFGVNKTLVLLKDMVIRKGESSSVSNVTGDIRVENFKRFKKVRLPYQRSAPHIIGGKDLIVYETHNNSYSKNIEDYANSDEAEEDEVDQWAFKPSQKTTKTR